MNELADNSQEALDSQTLAREIQNLMEEQEEEAISERDNYERILSLAKFDKKLQKNKDVESEDEIETSALKKTA
jgi:hypothetical protein